MLSRGRPGADEYGSFFGNYIPLVPEGDLLEILQRQGTDSQRLWASLTEEQAGHRYAPDKWSVKAVVGHIADNERIMSYRLMRIARGDTTPLPGYDQNVLVPGAGFDALPLAQIADDYTSVRQATLSLLRNLSEEAWTRVGTASGTAISARALACVICGHERHHLRILKERYGIG